MMRTATALTIAWASRGLGPQTAHPANASTATTRTAGTKYRATRLTSRSTGARVRWASPTMRTIRASSVSSPIFSTRTSSPPVPFTVPPTTAAPGPFSTGIGSPDTIDSSTALVPSSTAPSAGTFSPGRTRTRSPGRSAVSGTSSSRPSGRTTRAVFGASPRSRRIALPVRLRAFSSSTCPSRTSTVTTAAVSKYGSTAPPIVRNPSGKSPGAAVAARL